MVKYVHQQHNKSLTSNTNYFDPSHRQIQNSQNHDLSQAGFEI
jgi:hypothetical protein